MFNVKGDLHLKHRLIILLSNSALNGIGIVGRYDKTILYKSGIIFSCNLGSNITNINLKYRFKTILWIIYYPNPL